MQVIFSKALFDLGVGWTYFYKIQPIYLMKVFGYRILFVILKDMQLLNLKL
jgi:hypothetical protein